MLICNRVMLKKAGAFTAHPTAVAVFPHRFAAVFIIKNLNAALVWSACGQSERK
jgi:hypothetical protein